MTPMRNRAALLVATLAFAVAGCDGSGPDAKATLTLTECPRDIAEPPAVGGAQCGELAVPENPEQPDGPQIELAIKRWPAISAAPEPDPVFVIAGGPGQSARQVADRLSRAFYELRKKRDIVFVDQRGTGASAPMHCDEIDPQPLMVYSEAATDKTVADLRQCAEGLAERARYYTTAVAIEDLEQVRRALGYERLNLWGGSYGTRVVLTYMAHYPESLRSVVMDGLAPVALALPFSVGSEATRSLELVAEQCRQLPACQQRYGDIEQKAGVLAERLADSPVTIEIEDPLTGAPQSILLDRAKLVSLVRFALYDRLASRLLPAMIAGAHGEDYRLVGTLISELNDPDKMPNLAQGMHMTIICNEDAGMPNPPEGEPFLGVNLGEAAERVCAFWPEAPVEPGYYQPVESDVPALLLSGQRDPVTPPAWGERVAETLANATHLVAPGAHHGVTTQGCASDLMSDFVRELTLAESNTNCLQKIRPLTPYLTPAAESGERDND